MVRFRNAPEGESMAILWLEVVTAEALNDLIGFARGLLA
jgi:hypothetical protein